MSMVKILKNASLEQQNILGILVEPNQSINISHNLWAKLASTESLLNLISSGIIVINNGKCDLNSTAGVSYAKILQVDNFSYNNIHSDCVVVVDSGQQMRVFNELNVTTNGELFLDGDLVVSDK